MYKPWSFYSCQCYPVNLHMYTESNAGYRGLSVIYNNNNHHHNLYSHK